MKKNEPSPFCMISAEPSDEKRRLSACIRACASGYLVSNMNWEHYRRSQSADIVYKI